MVNFVVYFFICNLFISGMIGILLITKKAFKTTLSSRMQYHLGFMIFVLLALPFIPIRIFNIFPWLNTLTLILRILSQTCRTTPALLTLQSKSMTLLFQSAIKHHQ